MKKTEALSRLTSRLRKNKKGFTLVELLVVLAILAILIAVAVPVMTGALNDAKDKSHMSDARAAYIAFELLRTDSGTSVGVTNNEIATYLAKTGAGIKCVVKFKEKTADISDFSTAQVDEFYYTDTSMTRGGTTKWIKISMDNKATVETGAASGEYVEELPAS